MRDMRERERRYGLERGELEWLRELGGDVCWICGEPESVPGRSLAVDHDHETGTVRGLLCGRCNQVLGRMRDDAALLRRAADYLDRSRAAFSDACKRCMHADAEDWIATPHAVVETDGAWTLFAYEHDCGETWTCGWATRGVPFGWKM